VRGGGERTIGGVVGILHDEGDLEQSVKIARDGCGEMTRMGAKGSSYKIGRSGDCGDIGRDTVSLVCPTCTILRAG